MTDDTVTTENRTAGARTPGGSSVTAQARDHHADLWAELTARGYALIEAVGRGEEAEPERAAMLALLDDEVAEHVRTEEAMVYSIARGAGETALVAALELDHRALLRQVETLRKAPTAMDAALAARAVLLLFALRMEKEEKVLLPALADRGVRLDEMLQGRPEVVGSPSSPSASSAS